MHFSGSFAASVILLLLNCALLATPTTSQERSQSQQGKQEEPLKEIKTPIAPYPIEAVKKGIEGKVTLRIVVDAKGTVSQAEALSGPEELIPAALASVKMWQFEPPGSAPVTKTVEVEYWFPKECAGSISDFGEVIGNGRLVDKDGRLVAEVDSDDYALPFYPGAERKLGIAGNMVLSVTLKPDGRVKKIHVLKSLSPALDKAAMANVRPLKFKRAPGNPNASLNDLRLTFVFRALCNAHP